MELRKHSDDNLRLVLLGPTSSGKTATANAILGTEAFPESVTTACKALRKKFQGRDIWVIDTPGLSESAEVKREIQRSLSLGPPAPTVFLFIVDLTKIAEREWSLYLKMVEEIFGNDVLTHVMVLFTQRDKFTKKGFEKLLNSTEIQDLIRSCGGNCSMYSKKEVNLPQVETFMKHIKAMKTMNCNQPVENLGRQISELSVTGSKSTDMERDIFEDAASSDFDTTEGLTKGCAGGCEVSDHLDIDNQTLDKELGKGREAEQTEQDKQNKHEKSMTNETHRDVVEKCMKHIKAMKTMICNQPVENLGGHPSELSNTGDGMSISKNTDMERDVFEDVASSDFDTTEGLTKGCAGGCEVSDHLDIDNQTLDKELGKGREAEQTEQDKQNKHEKSMTNKMQREAVEEMRKREEDMSEDKKGNLEATSTETLCGEEESMMKPSRLQHTKKHESASMKIVLLGPIGSGKTSTANGLLRRKAFPESPTTFCNVQRGEFQGRGIWVIDTPGLQASDKVKQEIKRSLNLGPPVPTVLLFVIQQNKQDSGKWEYYVKLIEEILGKAAMRHFMILFTQNETLGKVGNEKILNNQDTQNLLRSCNGWYYIFNKESQVEELLRKMKMMVVSEADLRIVLLGKTGAGKSSSGNTILGKVVYNSDFSTDSVTATCQRVFSEVVGRRVSLVDTPGLFDTQKSVDVVKSEIEKCVDLSLPGPHVFLVVMRLDVRFTDEERNSVKWIKDNFGEGAAKFTMVLFTRADQLRGKSVEEMLKGDLKTLIDSCSGYHVFNNEEKEDKTQVKELLEKIDNMVEKNGGKCYTNEMYQEAQRKLKETRMTLKGLAGGAVAGATLGLATGFVPGALIGAAAGAVAGGGGAALTFLARKVPNHREADLGEM